MYAARQIVTKKMKRPFLPRQGKGCGTRMTTPKAATASARRNGCTNNPVEPAAIQAAARPAITAITGLVAVDVTTEQSVVNSSDFLCLFRTTRWIIAYKIHRAIRKKSNHCADNRTQWFKLKPNKYLPHTSVCFCQQELWHNRRTWHIYRRTLCHKNGVFLLY